MYVPISQCPILHFSDPPARLLTTCSHLPPRVFYLFLPQIPQIFCWWPASACVSNISSTSYGFTTNSAHPSPPSAPQSDRRSVITCQTCLCTSNSQLPLFFQKVGKKLECWVTSQSYQALKQLFPGQQCWAWWLWPPHWTWHGAFYWAAAAASRCCYRLSHIGLILLVSCLETG